MNKTLELLQIIGSPFASPVGKLSDPRKSLELYYHSIQNRMPLLYLNVFKKNAELENLQLLYEKEYARYLKTLDSIANTSRLLTDTNVEHAIYKTLRPYEATTVDIDVLIFDPRHNYQNAIRTMQKAGHEIIEYGPRSTTLFDPRVHIGIDLYDEVSVSLITYLDKEKLALHTTNTRLPTGKYVTTLTPEADLLTIIAHSVIKEQMYVLSEYYSFIYYIRQLNVQKFTELVKENNLTSATRAHTAITAVLHQIAHKVIPEKLQRILEEVDNKTIEISMLMEKNLEVPHKYHMTTVARSLLEVSRAEKSRRSIAAQLVSMLNPKFTRKVVERLADHMTRKTY